MNATSGRAHGFTLIELLVVIAILGGLVVFFLPDLLGAQESAKETTTLANLSQLSVGCNTFETKHHYYPPDDLADPEGKLQWKGDNGTNTGIESLVAFLSQSQADGSDLTTFGSHRLTNTDGDEHGAMLPLLGSSERREVADEWGTPLAYFCKTTKSGGFDKPQSIVPLKDLPPIQARARKNAEGQALGGRKFQLLSAGRDGLFNTDDDLSFPQ